MNDNCLEYILNSKLLKSYRIHLPPQQSIFKQSQELFNYYLKIIPPTDETLYDPIHNRYDLFPLFTALSTSDKDGLTACINTYVNLFYNHHVNITLTGIYIHKTKEDPLEIHFKTPLYSDAIFIKKMNIYRIYAQLLLRSLSLGYKFKYIISPKEPRQQQINPMLIKKLGLKQAKMIADKVAKDQQKNCFNSVYNIIEQCLHTSYYLPDYPQKMSPQYFQALGLVYHITHNLKINDILTNPGNIILSTTHTNQLTPHFIDNSEIFMQSIAQNDLEEFIHTYFPQDISSSPQKISTTCKSIISSTQSQFTTLLQQNLPFYQQLIHDAQEHNLIIKTTPNTPSYVVADELKQIMINCIRFPFLYMPTHNITNKQHNSLSHTHTQYNTHSVTSPKFKNFFRAFFRSEEHYNLCPLPYTSTSCPIILEPTYENLIGAYIYKLLQPPRAANNINFSYTDRQVYLYTQSTARLTASESISPHLQKEIDLHKPLADLLGIPLQPQNFIVYPCFTSEQLQIAPQNFFHNSPTLSTSYESWALNELQNHIQLFENSMRELLTYIKEVSPSDSALYPHVIFPLENIINNYNT